MYDENEKQKLARRHRSVGYKARTAPTTGAFGGRFNQTRIMRVKQNRHKDWRASTGPLRWDLWGLST